MLISTCLCFKQIWGFQILQSIKDFLISFLPEDVNYSIYIFYKADNKSIWGTTVPRKWLTQCRQYEDLEAILRSQEDTLFIPKSKVLEICWAEKFTGINDVAS